MPSMISVWRGWVLGVLLCEMGCASLDQAATGRDSHFSALRRLGCSVSGSPVCSPLRSGPLGRGAVGGRMGLPGSGRGSWRSESLLVGRTCRLCVLVSPIWVPLGSRFPGAPAVIWGRGLGWRSLPCWCCPPRHPPLLPAWCLFPPASSSPHFLHFLLTLAGSGGCALSVSSSPPAWTWLWGGKGEVTLFCSVLWLAPSRSSTHSPAPRTPGAPSVFSSWALRAGPSQGVCLSLSSRSEDVEGTLNHPAPQGSVRRLGRGSARWHPAPSLLCSARRWALWSQGWSALGGYASRQALSLGEPQFPRVPASRVMGGSR